MNEVQVIKPAHSTLTDPDAWKWFEFGQNNSGGYFIRNDVVDSSVIVQARNAGEAMRTMAALVDDYSEYCDCCGQRWWVDVDDDEGTETPMIYGKSVYDMDAGFVRDAAILHHADGKVERVVFAKAEK